MDRRDFLKAGTLVPAAAALSGLPRMAAAASHPQWRVFEVTTEVEILRPAGTTQVWLPVPLIVDTDYQKSLGNSWNAERGEITFLQRKSDRMGMVHAAFPQSGQTPRLTLVSLFATRDRTVDLSSGGRVAQEDPAILELNLQPTELLPTDGIVRDTAREITKRAGTDIQKARAIYEWVVDNTFRDPKVRGCGWGDIRTMLETRNLGGKCGDLNSLFVGLARAAGVPARDVYGVRVAPSLLGYRSLGANSEVISKAQHCRAEFYAHGIGWIPVDPADVRKVVLEEPPGRLALDDAKVLAARERLFGSWEMNWVAYNYAHDVHLPGSNRTWVPYLMYPNGETANGRLDQLDPGTFRYALTARELTA